jgi:general secretion pathway protein H
LLLPRPWGTEIDRVTIRYPGVEGSSGHADRMVFGVEAIDAATVVTLYGPSAQVSIVSTGNGRYAVQ